MKCVDCKLNEGCQCPWCITDNVFNGEAKEQLTGCADGKISFKVVKAVP